MSHDLFARHREMLEKAVTATQTREYFSAFDESPSPRVYGENAAWIGCAVTVSEIPSSSRACVPRASLSVS